MKKVFLFAVAAAALVACSNEELSTPENSLVNSKEAPVNFSVYTQRGMTRAGVPGDLDNANIGATGFGVFAYYTAGENYDAKATPNFMYNQKVTSTDANVTANSVWTYEPVKYWPNEYGSDAISDEVDRVSFFAYAPWTEVDPTTGNVVAANEKAQKYNIISVNKNTATGDPMVKYVVDTDPTTSVDLLWGVAAEQPESYYSGPIQGQAPITAGKPFIDLLKPANPASDKLNFNLKHALAKVRVTIDYIDDATTPGGPAATKINSDQTRIYVRNFKMNGFAMKGALNLNNSEGTAGEPLWKDFDGVKDLSFEDVIFQDGRKDGKEGETNGAQTNETPQGLNPAIIENYATITPATAGTPATFGAGKSLGVGAMTLTENNGVVSGVVKDATVDATSKAVTGTVLLFGGDPAENGGYFYVIPRNEQTNGSVSITIAYDVETIDPALAGKISDGETHGISIENVITKNDIFQGIDFKAGYTYDIQIHLGMTSVKITATVTDWKAATVFKVDLPDNQPANQSGNQGGNTPFNPSAGSFAETILNAIQGATATSDTEVTIPAPADLAATLTALHNAGVTAITYNGTTYTWSDGDGPNHDNQGYRTGGPDTLLQRRIDTNNGDVVLTTDGIVGTITLDY